MSHFSNPRRSAALASLHAAFGPVRVTRPAPVVNADARSRRLVLSVGRA
jgi:hypothetical protein